MIISKTFLRENFHKTIVYTYIFKCDNCQEKFTKIGTEAKLKNKRFCSIKCKGVWIRKNRLTSEIISNGLKRFYSKNNVWNKGLNKFNNESIKKISDHHLIPNGEFQKMTRSDEHHKKISESLKGEKNPFFGKKHSNKSKSKISKKRSENIANGTINLKGLGIKGWYFSSKNNTQFYHDSFWELLRMKILDLDENVINWTKRHKIKIPYVFEKIKRNYIPDFLIQYKNKRKVLEEVKGYEEEKRKKLKFKLLKRYCEKNNLEPNIITHKELTKLCNIYFKKSIEDLRKEFK